MTPDSTIATFVRPFADTNLPKSGGVSRDLQMKNKKSFPQQHTCKHILENPE